MTFVTTDIDECKEKKKCLEKQNCFNEVGSYRCSCIDGYRKVEEVCVPSLTIYLVVGEYIYRMSISYD